MQKMTAVILALTLVTGLCFAQTRITESLANWTLGVNSPEISTGDRGDGSNGGYIHMLVGTSPMYYEVMAEGEGGVDFWIYDPGKCLETVDPGYGYDGPGWGLQTLLYQAVIVCINRKDYISGCQGYSPWSTVAPYSPWWYYSGLRGSSDVPYTPHWIRWSVYGTWDDITFTTYDVDYSSAGGIEHGDVGGTYEAASFDGGWAGVFGDGWKAFYLRGDGASGIEDVNADVPGGSGVFAEFGVSAARLYAPASWAEIKNLYR